MSVPEIYDSVYALRLTGNHATTSHLQTLLRFKAILTRLLIFNATCSGGRASGRCKRGVGTALTIVRARGDHNVCGVYSSLLSKKRPPCSQSVALFITNTKFHAHVLHPQGSFSLLPRGVVKHKAHAPVRFVHHKTKRDIAQQDSPTKRPFGESRRHIWSLTSM